MADDVDALVKVESVNASELNECGTIIASGGGFSGRLVGESWCTGGLNDVAPVTTLYVARKDDVAGTICSLDMLDMLSSFGC